MVKRSPKPIVYPIYKYLLHGEACICPKSACTHQSPPSADMCGRPAGAYLYRGYDRWYCIDLVIPPELSDEKDAAGGTGSRGCGLTPPGAKFGCRLSILLTPSAQIELTPSGIHNSALRSIHLI